MNADIDVLVIGAGLSGLYAARTLKRSGLKVAVLEARDRVGGRVWSRRLANGATIDLGGQWIGPGQRRMYALVKEYGLKTIVTHTRGDEVFSVGEQCQRGKTSPMSWLGKFDTLQVAWRMSCMVNKLSVTEPWQHSWAARLDNISFAEWLRKNTLSEEARLYWLHLTEAGIFDTPPPPLR